MHLVPLFLAAVAGVLPAAEHDHSFLRIYNPIEREKYADTANMAVTGYLYLPNRDDEPKSFYVRVRLYRPADGKFVIAQETTAEVKPAKREKGVYSFLGDINRKVPFKPGQYLLRVDCRDKTVKNRPVIATQSVFVEIASRSSDENDPTVTTKDP